MRVLSVILLLGLIGWPFSSTPASVQEEAPGNAAAEVSLKGGGAVRGDILQRTDDRLVLDLGFTVLQIPAAEIVSNPSPWTSTETPSEETGTTAHEAPDAAPPPADLPRPEPPVDFESMVDRLESAVVIVSNPGGLGAGFFIDDEGRLLTNHHVVRGAKYNDVTVFKKLPNGRVEKKVIEKVEVKAYSSLMDCALLQAPVDEFREMEIEPLRLAPAESLRTSMEVFALGNPGLGAKILDHSVTEGILSSTTRNFDDILYLQTTAAINPGNSGGPLLNRRGEVVGLVTFRAIFQEGLGFALPVWYLHHFADNASAFAPTGDDKNAGFRYRSPLDEPDEERDAEGE